MRILMLRPQLELGGVIAHMELLARGLHNQGHTVMIGSSGGAAAARFASVPVPILKLSNLYPSRPHGLLFSALRISSLVYRLGIQLLHSHHRFTTIVGRFVAQLTRRPLVVTAHEFKLNWRGFPLPWSGDAVVTPSVALAEHLATYYGVPKARLHVVPNAVPFPQQQYLKKAEHEPVVLFVGRLSEEKGARYFVESLGIISAAVPGVRAMIVGDGPEAPELRRYAEQLGFDPQQLFLGSRDDVPALLAASDVVVVPSLAESFSLVALEAMHHGCAVVASAVGGLPEIVRDGETGRLVPPRDTQALGQAVSALLRDREELERLALAGQISAQRNYSPELMVQRTLAVYQSVLR